MPIKKKIKKVKRIFVTITDVASIFMAFLYIVYVAMMIAFPLGTMWLNFGMLGITIVHMIFLIVKILYLNKVCASRMIKKVTKQTIRIVKYGMKGVNAVFIVLGTLSVTLAPSHIFSMMGVMIFVFTFILSVTWDIVLFFVKRKIKNVLNEWNSLCKDGKKEKVDFLIERLLQSIDEMCLSGFEDYIDYGTQATAIIAGKINAAKTTEEK